MKCDLCGDGSFDGDEVVEYTDQGHAHTECAAEAGWESQ